VNLLDEEGQVLSAGMLTISASLVMFEATDGRSSSMNICVDTRDVLSATSSAAADSSHMNMNLTLKSGFVNRLDEQKLPTEAEKKEDEKTLASLQEQGVDTKLLGQEEETQISFSGVANSLSHAHEHLGSLVSW
jgi:hypothetical protein